jgi:hypothetical protein
MKTNRFEYFKLDTYNFGYWKLRAVDQFKSRADSFMQDVASKHYHTIFDAVEEIHKIYIKEVIRPERPYNFEEAKADNDFDKNVVARHYEAEYYGEPTVLLIEDSLNIEVTTPVRYRLVKKINKISTIEVDGKVYQNQEDIFEYGDWAETMESCWYFVEKITIELLE